MVNRVTCPPCGPYNFSKTWHCHFYISPTPFYFHIYIHLPSCVLESRPFLSMNLFWKKKIYIYIYINQTQNVQDGTSNAITHAILSNVVTQSKMEAKH